MKFNTTPAGTYLAGCHPLYAFGVGGGVFKRGEIMKRSDAIPYVSFVVDDAGCGRELGADQHAIVRPGNPNKRLDDPNAPHCYPSVLVGWQCGFEPLFVAVHSYLDVKLDDCDAEDMAREYLEERGWFDGSSRDHHPDYCIR